MKDTGKLLRLPSINLLIKTMTDKPDLNSAIQILQELRKDAIANQAKDPDNSAVNQLQWKGYIEGIDGSIYRLRLHTEDETK